MSLASRCQRDPTRRVLIAVNRDLEQQCKSSGWISTQRTIAITSHHCTIAHLCLFGFRTYMPNPPDSVISYSVLGEVSRDKIPDFLAISAPTPEVVGDVDQ